jgi:hypothetical protein
LVNEGKRFTRKIKAVVFLIKLPPPKLNNSLCMKSIILLLSISLYSLFSLAQDPCASVSIAGGNGVINVTGLSGAAIVGVQVFNSSWASVHNQTYTNPAGGITVSSLTAGEYFVNVRLYTSAWASICEKGGNATVTSGPPPPTDTCGATFQKTFGLPGGNDQGFNIINTSDGNLMVVGNSSASGTTNHDGLVMKFNNIGTLLWSKTLGGAQEDHLTEVVATPDGGCVAGGRTNTAGLETYSGDIWFVRIDGNGNILWQKRYFIGGTAGGPAALTATSDGGFAFSGTFPNTPGLSDWIIVKLDAGGNIQWQKKLGTGNSDSSVGLVEDDHGGAGLVASGIIYSSSWYDAVITKLDMSGNLVWTKAYDFDSRGNWLGPVYKVSDGFVFSTRNALGYDKEDARLGILKTDFSGNIIWAREFTAPNCREGRMTVLPDGGFMMVESQFPHDAASDNHLLRIDAAGNLLWAKKYPRTGTEWFNNLAANDNYVMGAGFANSGSYSDVLLARADLSGKMATCSSTNVTVTPRNPIVTTLNFTWPTNAALSLSTENLAYLPTAYNPIENVLCSDGCPAVTIGNATVNENAGNASLQVCLSAPVSTTVVYSYSTANGSATSGSDYTGGAGTVTIPAGQTCGAISIPILNDGVIELAETFTVSIGSVTGTVTINDDDDQPQLNCSGVTFTPGSNVITVSGVTAPVATVQLFNSSWASVFNQTYTNSPGTVNVPMSAGTYLVKVTFYTSNWAYVCDKTENVTVINQCPAGSICISNSCPSQTVNLNTAYAPVLPAGTTVTWHTGSPATDANKMTDEQAQNVAASGTYYAAINISGANCYSATIPVNVTIIACSSPGVVNAVQVKSEDQPATRNIMVFPNPFTRSLRVIIDSEKKEKATLILMDVQGRQLKQMPVQLSRGSNTVLMEGLDKYPSGNYFLGINSESGMKTLKVIRQQ